MHGLPGSGKSKLLKWIKQYFEEVWQWEHGIHFVLLAPLNRMATGIGGQTLHSWGDLKLKKSSGLEVGSGVASKGRDNIGQMHVKCARIRFILIDECECVGAATAADLESSTLNGVSTHSTCKLHAHEMRQKYFAHHNFAGAGVCATQS